LASCEPTANEGEHDGDRFEAKLRDVAIVLAKADADLHEEQIEGLPEIRPSHRVI
jgi:hypothetical protein